MEASKRISLWLATKKRNRCEVKRTTHLNTAWSLLLRLRLWTTRRLVPLSAMGIAGNMAILAQSHSSDTAKVRQ